MTSDDGSNISKSQMKTRLKALWDDTIQRLPDQCTHEVEDSHWRWLEGLDDTQAFLVCIGAGPWQAKRRHGVQNAALQSHAEQGQPDLAYIAPSRLGYPLTWQVKKIMAMRLYLLKIRDDLSPFGPPFANFCDKLRHERDPHPLYDVVGRSKVIELFVRDHLFLPSFPIDRHVRRALKAYQLPCDPGKIIQMCADLDHDSRLLSRMLFRLESENQSLGGSKWRKNST